MDTTDNELAELSRKLNQKTDSLNNTFTSFNEKLATLKIGVEAWVTVEEGDPFYDYEKDEHGNFPLHAETWLGYCRFERGWELAVRTVTRQETGNFGFQGEMIYKTVEATDAIPLLNASRDIRVKAIEFIPRLLDAIKEKAQEILQSIEKAEKAAEQL